MSTGHLALAIDIGGTFTDVVVLDQETGRFHAHKELTTPDNPARGVTSGIARLFAREGLAYAEVARIVHATTLFTNALIERRGARTGLITTAGFRDTLEIGHERKYELYDLHLPLPEPLVRRSLRLEARERMGPDGSVEQPLDAASLREAAARLSETGIESLAVVFLHAYANPAHEREAARILAEAHPGLPVSLSSEVAPQIREFDRTSTTVANAYIRPLADAYLGRLSADLQALGLRAPLFMMLSNGGLTHLDEARRVPVQLLESGPAAGALAAAVFGARSGLRDLLAFDMGGTTAKLCVVQDGEPLIAHRFEAGRERRFTRGSGLPLAISTVELIEIGAGGGSIARLDALGLLKVGPRSAGSEPGPACYARGGEAPTVTDANLLLGLLDAEGFAGGTMRLDTAAATRAVGGLAEEGGLDVPAAAGGIHAVVNETMAAAARVHVAEHGRDARDFALLLTGGGGPLHGCEVARRLGIRRVVCPPAAGVASALGLLLAPARVDRVGTLARELDQVTPEALEAAFRRLEEEAGAVVAATVGAEAPRRIRRSADMRFAGQGYEIAAALPDGPYGADARAVLREAFLAAYDAIFARRPPVRGIEVVNIRVSVSAAPPGRPLLPGIEAGGAEPRERRLRPGGADVTVPVFQRRGLGPGARLRGPALVEDGMSTLVLPPGAETVMEASGNLLVTLPEARTEIAQ
ncbi:MAG TPA: hydantoinase/oxoprolinase family protein [Crenalkalicoccus sp.]|nr:hydantoinase/oxoprolinase family protein [Crenalkalicoccus sp.]